MLNSLVNGNKKDEETNALLSKPQFEPGTLSLFHVSIFKIPIRSVTQD